MSAKSARVSTQPTKYLSVDSRHGTGKANETGRLVAVRSPTFLAPFDSCHFLRSKNVENRYHYVTSPFKQGRHRNVYNAEMFPEPDAHLKEQTISSIHLCKVKLQSEDARCTPNNKRQLLHHRKKPGRLQPLLGRPVIKGPTIEQCMGITSDISGLRSSSKLNKSSSPMLSPWGTSLSSRSNYIKKNIESLLRPESSAPRNSYSSMGFAADDSSSSEDEPEQEQETDRNFDSSRSKLRSRVKFYDWSSDEDIDLEVINRVTRKNVSNPESPSCSQSNGRSSKRLASSSR